MAFNNPISKFFTKGDSRTLLLKKNIIGSVTMRGISMAVSLILIPLTIDYVDNVRYGIWLALGSIVQWLLFFDIGVAMGLRNRFAEAKAAGNTVLAREYISTAYASITVMALILLAFAIPLSHAIDWSAVLKVPESYRAELSQVMAISISFFALNLILAVMSNILTGDQLTAVSSLIGVIGQIVLLIVISCLVAEGGSGSLVTLAWLLSGIPPCVLLIATIILFATRYRCYLPSPRMVRPRLIKGLLGIGGKFFIITVSMIIVFQLMNVIISRELGPETVTEYNVAYKYFNTVTMIFMMVLTPFWAASTDAFAKGNFDWIRGKMRQLERMMWLGLVPGIALMLGVSQVVFRLWVGDSVAVSWTTSIAIALYITILCTANIYMHIINGIGKVQLQLWIYVGFALISYPVMTLLCRYVGIPGLLLVPALIYLVQALAMRIQLTKILAGKATGIWNR